MEHCIVIIKEPMCAYSISIGFYSPGHGVVAQGLASMGVPGQYMPAPVSCLSITLPRTWVPVPQVTPQLVHADHIPHTQAASFG